MMITKRSKRTLGLLAATALVPVLAACGSSGGSDSATTPAATSSSTAPESGTTTSSAPSGGKPVLASGTAPASRTIAVTKTAFTPSTLTIKTGENVTFKADGPGTFGVEVGGLDSATVTGGLIETFEFPEAGTYEVNELVSGIKATITVE